MPQCQLVFGLPHAQALPGYCPLVLGAEGEGRVHRAAHRPEVKQSMRVIGCPWAGYGICRQVVYPLELPFGGDWLVLGYVLDSMGESLSQCGIQPQPRHGGRRGITIPNVCRNELVQLSL